MGEFLRRAIFQANAVVDTGVVDERVNFAEVLRRGLNGALTLGGVGKFALKRAVTMTRVSEFFFHLAKGSAVAIEHYRYGGFGGTAKRDGLADTFCAAADDDDF